MANVIPIKATFTSNTVTGLAEFQSGDTIDISTYLSASSITFAGDTGSDSASLGETLTISGTSNEIETAVTSNTVTIGLPDDVTIGNNLTVTGNLTVNGTTTTINSTTVDVVNSFRFEGSTSDDYETNLTVVDPTADRTITLPNATGTVSLLDNTETLSNKTISTLTVTGQAHTITDTTSGSSAGPELRLIRDITGADANYIGQILFVGDSDTGVSRNYAKITGKIGDASNGTEDGIIEIAHIKGGSQNINVRMTSTEFKIMNGTDFDVETHDGSSNGLRLGNTLVTATAAVLNHSDGVTSNIQTQLDAKATNAFAIAQAVALG